MFSWTTTGLDLGSSIVGSPSAASHTDRLHVIYRRQFGDMRYRGYCPGFCWYGAGVSEDVSIGHTTSWPLVYVDPGGPWGQTLHAISSTGSTLYWDFKVGQ